MSSASNPAAATSNDGSDNAPLYELYLKVKEKEETPSPPQDSFCLGLINKKLKNTKPDDNSATEQNVASSLDAVPRVSDDDDLNQSGQVPPQSQPIGFENEELWLVQSIIKPAKDNFKAIGIVGMPQFGKTELCGLVFNNEYVKQYFAPRIWVAMSGKQSQRHVVEMILKQLDEDNIIDEYQDIDDSIAIPSMHYALYLKLVGKRYLIVLDDIQDGIEKYGFSSVFPKGSGGAVIVTVRQRSVAEKMVGTEEEGENIYSPQPIADSEKCWEIYNSFLEEKVNNPTDELKKGVRKKSGGLPLAVKLMAEIKNEQKNAERIKNEQKMAGIAIPSSDKKSEENPKKDEDKQGNGGNVDQPVGG